MPLTPDSSLTLAFSASLIPASSRSHLPSGIHLRPLSSSDHARSHLSVLSTLASAPDPGAEAWLAQFTAMRNTPDTYYPLVLLDEATDQIVGMATLVMERKFLRGGSWAGHVEDVAVSEGQQGKGLGKKLVVACTELCEALGGYKTILDCDPKNEGFYVKCGYETKGLEMKKYAS